MLGAEAAARLAELDRQRAAWTARLEDYRARRAAIEGSISDPGDRTSAIEDLLARSFSAEERIRVEALDRMDGVTP